MNRTTNIIGLLFVAALFSMAQAVAGPKTLADTVVMFTGTVIDKGEKTPLKATIEYKKLPYGNEIGRVTTDDNGQFTIYFHGNALYDLKVKFQGFFSYSEEVQVGASSLGRNIELESGDVGYTWRLHNLIFAQGSDAIPDQAYAELQDVVTRMIEFPNMEIQLEGHTDWVGNAGQNMALSERRVNSVKTYLVSQGIASGRIKTVAYGGTKPLSREETPEAGALNRRVEVRILRLE